MPAGNGAVFNNLSSGVFALETGSSFTYDTGAWPVFINAGTLTNAVGSSSAIDATFTNSGMVNVQSNSITFNHGYFQTSGSTTVAAGASMGLASSGAWIGGGTLSGNGLVDGPLTNSATVKPGSSPGVLNFNYFANAYSQSPGGVLAIEIGGTAPGTQYGQLAVGNGGTASLNGTLKLTMINGFAPTLGEAFSVVSCGARSGSFAAITGNHLGNGLVLVPRYSGTNVSLVVANELVLSGPARNQDGFDFTVTSTTGLTNVVECTDSLAPPVLWQTLTNLTGDGGLVSFFDAWSGRRERFYRVRFQ
jgi:hypothetical protein